MEGKPGSGRAWRMVFEALLRLGGNMVIPGTDRNAHRYRKLASDMGLAITHHHAEPLGQRCLPVLSGSECLLCGAQRQILYAVGEGCERTEGYECGMESGIPGPGGLPLLGIGSPV